MKKLLLTVIISGVLFGLPFLQLMDTNTQTGTSHHQFMTMMSEDGATDG